MSNAIWEAVAEGRKYVTFNIGSQSGRCKCGSLYVTICNGEVKPEGWPITNWASSEEEAASLLVNSIEKFGMGAKPILRCFPWMVREEKGYAALMRVCFCGKNGSDGNHRYSTQE